MTTIKSHTTQSEIAAAAGREINPPAHVPLTAEDMPFFDSIIAEFSTVEWTDHKLELAALLARMMCDCESDTRLLRIEGTTAKSEKGTPVINPRKTAVQMYSQTILAMRRSLSLNARAQAGEARDIGKRRSKAKEIEADAVSAKASDLIARPGMH